MSWKKKNLVSNKDLSDTWGCTECGYVKDYKLGQRPIECPQCLKKKPLGWWTTTQSDCSICGAKGKLVPREGHALSDFWRLQRYTEEKLRYCPEGCLDGESAMDVIKRLRKELKNK